MSRSDEVARLTQRVLVNVNYHIKRAGIAVSVFAASAWVGSAYAQISPAGTEVSNVATITFRSDGSGPTSTLETNQVLFVISDPAPGAGVPAEIDFYRYSPTSPDAVNVAINGSDFAPSGATNGPFSAVGQPRNPGGVTIDTSQPVPLTPATTYLAGETMFVRVVDRAADRDPTAIDTVVVTIEGDNGDLVTLRLYETGPNTGEFFAYVGSTRDATVPNDNQFSTPGNTLLTASYADALTGSDVVFDTALANPLNRVFSTVDGSLIDGAEVSLVDASTGGAATTFGIDGFSTFPATQISGDEVIDGAGLVYELDAGEFRYPHVTAGTYAIRVDPPEGFTFASSLDPSTIIQNTDGSFVITGASFGELFTQDNPGPLRFDIPLDPISNLLVTKTADRATADVGDFVSYTVEVRNNGAATVPLNLSDTLPLGFRYVPGTARLESQPVADPNVSDNATMLTFAAGLMAPGDTVRLQYALLVGPGAPLGDAVNRAFVTDAQGEPISNIARAEVRLREDLLRSTSTIIGRVTQNSCDGDEDWARDIRRGDGVEGVRLYMETGAYAVSDADGLYHFEGVSEGTHVVQVDTETLPEGFEMMTCEESTRYAGRNFSTFVDVQGGGIWRANFYLKQTGVATQDVSGEEASTIVEAGDFDNIWLEEQDATPDIVYPPVGQSATAPSTSLGVKHAPGQTVDVFVNGVEVAETHISARNRNIGNSVMLTRYRGVDIFEGANDLRVDVRNADGTLAKRMEREIAYVTQLARARAVPDLSKLVADGATPPELAVRLEDDAGRPIFSGRPVRVDLEAPYLLFDPDRDIRIDGEQGAVSSALVARNEFKVGADGILRVPLEPTLKTGKATLIITLDNGRQVPLYYYLEPEKRDWIVVGLAEGTVGFETVRDKAVSLESDTDTFTDGRLAFFAKGLIKGEWLMTLAVDTDKRRSGFGDRDAGFREEIDPNAYYTLYGDRSYQEFEGVSRYPIYVKLEKRQGYALFGDFDTNVTEGRLTSYNRRLSGLKAEYIGENIQLLGFGAETNQGFALDEIPADSTSGTYQLSNRRVLSQSEQIVIETRDRVRPDIVLGRRVLIRYLDYTLDYFTGQLIFRQPVDATDLNFNPNVIVVSYETSEDAEKNITFGGRAQLELMGDRAHIGVTGVHEDGSALEAGSESTMIGVDAVARVTDSTEVRAEYAITENNGTGDTADAILGEIIHTSDGLQLEAYYQRQEAGFGLGQRTSNVNGAERYGARADMRISQTENEETGRRTTRSVAAAAYREENLRTGDTRSNLEVSARHDSDNLDLTGGLRYTQDKFTDGEDRQSLIVTGTGQYALPKYGATLSVSHEQPLGGDDEVSIYPARTTLGVDKTVGSWAVASIRHEILDGAQARSNNTTVGLDLTPWTGGTVTVSGDHLTQDSTRRISATVGVDQQVKLSENWAMSAGVRSRKVLDADGEYRDPVPDAAISPFETNEDFNSGYIGASYRDEVMSGSARIEGRSGSEGDTYIATLGVARELSEELSLAAAVRGFISEREGSNDGASQVQARIGAAWRPRNEDMVIFNRLDLVDEKTIDGVDTTKFVNNAAANIQLNDRWQLTGNWGVKHVKTDLLGTELSSWTHLLGAETRFDLTDWLDIGARGQILKTSGTDSLAYSYGPNVGVSPVDNVWISAGYNVEGYTDDDFEASEFSRKGPYIQIRLKFDQESARGLLRRISPSATEQRGSSGL